jgi:hypothetical protein
MRERSPSTEGAAPSTRCQDEDPVNWVFPSAAQPRSDQNPHAVPCSTAQCGAHRASRPAASSHPRRHQLHAPGTGSRALGAGLVPPHQARVTRDEARASETRLAPPAQAHAARHWARGPRQAHALGARPPGVAEALFARLRDAQPDCCGLDADNAACRLWAATWGLQCAGCPRPARQRPQVWRFVSSRMT